MSNNNVFTVDLGALKLTAEQRNNINIAIQKAVAAEVAQISLAQRVMLVPISSAFKSSDGGPIIVGFAARSQQPVPDTLLQ